MEFVNRIYGMAFADEVTTFFTYFILGWLAIGTLLILVRPVARSAFGAKFIAMTPTTLATLGILGTFTGILLGLQDFDVNRVDESVPQLLAGLKTAFVTSIVGIVAAVLFRLIRTLVPSGGTTEAVSPEDILAALFEIRDDGRRASQRSEDQLIELRKAISSEGDSNLLTQIQKLRTTVQDGQAEYIREFRDFAKHMTENSQRALIEALEQVIRDFNTKLTEQFGENFKQLNAAVHALVVWQDQYRQHVEALERRLDTAVAAVEASQKALESVASHSERIPEMMKPLEPVLSGINVQTKLLGGHLEAVASLRDKAVEAFPMIEANLQKLTTQFAQGVEEAVTASREAISEGQQAHAELRKGYDAFLTDAGTARERFSGELANALKQMSEQSSREFARHGELIQANAKEAQKVIGESWSKSVEKLNDQFTAFDSQMQQELTRALELLGRNLASVSEKLVGDYSVLTQKLRDFIVATRSA